MFIGKIFDSQEENDKMDVDVSILVDASTEVTRETQADLALTWSL